MTEGWILIQNEQCETVGLCIDNESHVIKAWHPDKGEVPVEQWMIQAALYGQDAGLDFWHSSTVNDLADEFWYG